MRRFKCQRYGHTANICKGKKRCWMCGDEHAYRECVRNVAVRCCKGGGNHRAA